MFSSFRSNLVTLNFSGHNKDLHSHNVTKAYLALEKASEQGESLSADGLMGFLLVVETPDVPVINMSLVLLGI